MGEEGYSRKSNGTQGRAGHPGQSRAPTGEEGHPQESRAPTGSVDRWTGPHKEEMSGKNDFNVLLQGIPPLLLKGTCPRPY